MRSPRVPSAVGATASLVGACLVFVAVELALVDRFPVFYDESLFVAEAQVGLDHPTVHNLFLAAMDNHGPLQRWLAMVWLWLGFGSITAIRLVSILSGLLVVVGVWLAARRLGRLPAALAAAAAAVMPGLIVHSAVGIADPLAVAFLTLALAAQLRLMEHPTPATGMAAGLALAGAVLTKKTALTGVALLPLTAPLPWRRAVAGDRPWGRWLAAAAVALACVAAAFAVLAMAPASLRHIGSVYSFVQYRSWHEVVHEVPGYLGGNVRDFASVIGHYATVPLLVAAVVGVADVARRRRDVAVVLVAWVVLPFAVAFVVAKLPYPRYVLASLPPLAVLAGAGLAAVWRWLERLGHGRALAPLGVAVLLAQAVVFDARVVASPAHAHYPGFDDVQYVSGFAAGTPWPALARALERASANLPRRNDVVVAYGGHSTGPIGLAGFIGRPKLAPGSINAVDFFATDAAGRRYHFVSYRSHPDARFVVAQELQAGRPPASLLAATHPLVVVQRPHGGSVVALLERR